MLYHFNSIHLELLASNTGITTIQFVDDTFQDTQHHSKEELIHLYHASTELDDYFAGKLTVFTVPIHIDFGTDFQRQVWDALRQIPYGETRTYKDIAIKVQSDKAYRAVGQANRLNPIPIIIPCHRVIGSNGKMTGYFGNSQHGIDLKKQLLCIEKNNSTDF